MCGSALNPGTLAMQCNFNCSVFSTLLLRAAMIKISASKYYIYIWRRVVLQPSSSLSWFSPTTLSNQFPEAAVKIVEQLKGRIFPCGKCWGGGQTREYWTSGGQKLQINAIMFLHICKYESDISLLCLQLVLAAPKWPTNQIFPQYLIFWCQPQHFCM